MEEQLKRAKAQRFIALENALKTVDSFCIPSCDPEMMDRYEKMKAYLMEKYKKGVSDSDLDELNLNNQN